MSLRHRHSTIVLFLGVSLLSGCASQRYEPTISQLAKRDGTGITDHQIWEHAETVARALEQRGQTARIARETSSTTQIILAGLSGTAAIASSGATTVAALAFGSMA